MEFRKLILPGYDMKRLETVSFLKVLASSKKNLDKLNYKPLDKAFKDIRSKIDKFKMDMIF